MESDTHLKKRCCFQKHKHPSEVYNHLLKSNDAKTAKILKLLFLDEMIKAKVQIHDFYNIWKKHKVGRGDVVKILKAQITTINVVEVILSNHLLCRLNAEGQNILFTYHAYTNPDGTIQFFHNYVIYYMSNIINKTKLFDDLKCEVTKIKNEKRKDTNHDNLSTISPSPFSPIYPIEIIDEFPSHEIDIQFHLFK